jgi:penicillin-binding protein 2
MHEVVQGATGTARRSGQGAEYAFAGKTGTAQVFSVGQDERYDADEIPEELRDHALFIAFAPLENPCIAIAIVVENGGGGSATAAPIARTLFDHYLKGVTAPGPGTG